MSRPIEQALSNLIPRHPGALPPELIELAGSLLSQSRNKASNLKPDEEVARAYACANIACERLKTTLNLPPIEPRPPIAPRSYNKLYAYLDRSLTTNTPGKRTGNQHATLGNNRVQKSLPQRHTPTKERSLESFRAGRRSEKKGLKYASNKEIGERIPGWVAPVVRTLCKEMQTRNAIPHILAGVESVIRTSLVEDIGNIPALIAAIWFYAHSKMENETTDEKLFAERQKLVIDVLGGMRDDAALIQKLGEKEAAWESWAQAKKFDVDQWLKRLAATGCLEMDWFVNIEPQVLDSHETDEPSDDEEWESTRSTGELRRARLGSMKVEKFNFLSEESEKDYKRWKKAIMLLIDQKVAEGAFDD